MTIPNLITFAIEGPDKVGKATQSRMLLAALEEMELLRSHLIEIPSKNHACHDKIYDMLRRREDGSAPAHDHPAIFQTFHAANRFHVQEDLARIAESGKTVVVFDRWHISGYIYGRVSGMKKEQLATIVEGMLVPDVTFILDGRGFDRPEQEDDAYEDDEGFQAKVRALYREHRPQDERIVVEHIEADHPKEIVHQQILTITTRTLVSRGFI